MGKVVRELLSHIDNDPLHLLAGVWSTLAECEDRCFAHANPLAFTG